MNATMAWRFLYHQPTADCGQTFERWKMATSVRFFLFFPSPNFSLPRFHYLLKHSQSSYFLTRFLSYEPNLSFCHFIVLLTSQYFLCLLSFPWYLVFLYLGLDFPSMFHVLHLLGCFSTPRILSHSTLNLQTVRSFFPTLYTKLKTTSSEQQWRGTTFSSPQLSRDLQFSRVINFYLSRLNSNEVSRVRMSCA